MFARIPSLSNHAREQFQAVSALLFFLRIEAASDLIENIIEKMWIKPCRAGTCRDFPSPPPIAMLPGPSTKRLKFNHAFSFHKNHTFSSRIEGLLFIIFYQPYDLPVISQIYYSLFYHLLFLIILFFLFLLYSFFFFFSFYFFFVSLLSFSFGA